MHQEIDPTRPKPPLPISLANILNFFKYGISSNSVIPAPAYARAGMTIPGKLRIENKVI